MDFELTEFQADLAEGVRRLCAGQFPLEQVRSLESTERVVDRVGWRRLGKAGVFNLCLAEAAGGVGLGLAEAALVFEELGRALLPGPAGGLPPRRRLDRRGRRRFGGGGPGRT